MKITAGRDILNSYLPTQDGQSALWELCQCARTSTAAKLRARNILSDLVNTPLTSSWNRPFVDYISWFGNKVLDYNKLVEDPAKRLSAPQICTMLERNVARASKLADVTRMKCKIACGKSPYTLEQYVSLLKSAAATVDRQTGRLYGRTNRPTRHGNNHDSDWSSPGSTECDDTPSSDSHEAFQADFQAWVTEGNSENCVDEKTWVRFPLIRARNGQP